MDSQPFVSLNEEYLFKTYNRIPIMLVRGEGARVLDSEGKEYMDFIAGIAACTLGHGHRELARAIADQAEKLIHVSNLFHIEPQLRLAKVLVDHSFADKVFFCNSGAEANEGAIKLARKYFHDRGLHDRYEIITMEGSFHGRTLATLAATGQTKFRKGFEPEMAGFRHVPFGDLEAVQSAVTDKTAAIMVEPIQGEGGVRVAGADYFRGLRTLCDETGTLLIFDEVQTGTGRTGKLFAYEHLNMHPDVMTLAKGIAGGVPLGAMLAVNDAASALGPGTHAATFGGNPLSCAAGLAVMGEVLTEGFLRRVEETGAYLRIRLEDIVDRFESVKEARGLGLMQAIETTRPCADLSSALRERGILVNCTAETVLRFVPPLIVTKEDIDVMLKALREVLTEWEEGAHGG